jgi:endonuclease-3
MLQTTFSFGQTAELTAIRDRLHRRFGAVPDRARLDPVSQFVRAFIGTRTKDAIALAAFDRLRARFADWDALANAPVAEIEQVLGDVTFADAKAQNLKMALEKIRVRAGSLNLDFLDALDVRTAHVWLEQIHGVGRAIAAAVLNRSTLRKRSFVLDTNIQRVLERFGFVKRGASMEAAYETVMAGATKLEADGLYELNWHLKMLGQKTCIGGRPLCELCPLSDICGKLEDKRTVRAALKQPSRGAGISPPI